MNLGVAGRGCPEEQSNVDMWFFLATHSSFTTEAGGSGRRFVNDKDIEISQAWVSSFIFSSQEGSLLLSKCAGLEVDESTAEYLFLVLPDVWFSPNSALLSSAASCVSGSNIYAAEVSQYVHAFKC